MSRMSDQCAWSTVESYFDQQLIGSDPALEHALRECGRHELPAISVSPAQGKLLHLIARMSRSRRILEVGTLGGYSAIWLARALPPDGTLITLELDPRHAEVARSNLEFAKLSHVTEIRVGPALDSLVEMRRQAVASFDMVFIDADKPNNPAYFAHAIALSHPGTIIIVDNVARGGQVTRSDSDDASVKGVRRMLELIRNEPRVSATAIQTVGSKGYDGVLIARVER